VVNGWCNRHYGYEQLDDLPTFNERWIDGASEWITAVFDGEVTGVHPLPFPTSHIRHEWGKLHAYPNLKLSQRNDYAHVIDGLTEKSKQIITDYEIQPYYIVRSKWQEEALRISDKGTTVAILGTPKCSTEYEWKHKYPALQTFLKKWCLKTFEKALSLDVGPIRSTQVFVDFANNADARAFYDQCTHLSMDKDHPLTCSMKDHPLTCSTLLTDEPKPKPTKLKCIQCRLDCSSLRGDRWCLKCSKKNYQGNVEVVLDWMKDTLPYHIGVKEIVALSGVSKMMNTSFNCNHVWKTVYIRSSVPNMRYKALNKMLKRKERAIETQRWSASRINEEGICRLALENDSEIPYDIYWGKPSVSYHVQQQAGGNRYMYDKVQEWKHMGQVVPGKLYVAGNAITNQRWCLVPTNEWLIDNPYSNYTFSFLIDASKVTDTRLSKTVVKPAFVKRINSDPHKVNKPFKGLTKIKDFRKATMRLLIDPATVNKKKDYMTHKKKLLEEQRVTLIKKLHALEREILDTTIKTDGCDMTSVILDR
jgi:hypothetical protein